MSVLVSGKRQLSSLIANFDVRVIYIVSVVIRLLRAVITCCVGLNSVQSSLFYFNVLGQGKHDGKLATI